MQVNNIDWIIPTQPEGKGGLAIANVRYFEDT